jgi:hypothetical protein
MLLASSRASAPSSSLSQRPQVVQVQPGLLVAMQATPPLQARLLALASVCHIRLKHNSLILTTTGGDDSASGTETGASASASATDASDSDNGAVRNSIAGAGLLGLVVAGLVL